MIGRCVMKKQKIFILFGIVFAVFALAFGVSVASMALGSGSG